MALNNNDMEVNEELITEAYNELQKKKAASKNSTPKSRKLKSKKDTQKEKINEAKFNAKLKKANSRKLGFTNKLAVSLVCLMVVSLIMGFILACFSIYFQYTGALACFTVCVTPLDTCLGIVLCKVVDKSKAENLSGDGTGISYMSAKASAFQEAVEASNEDFVNSPAI